eukprot:5132539-Amphidinium_carterae.1
MEKKGVNRDLGVSRGPGVSQKMLRTEKNNEWKSLTLSLRCFLALHPTWQVRNVVHNAELGKGVKEWQEQEVHHTSHTD